ncbi:MAG: hypothetical protein WCJ41_12160 [Aestuariivirga sp.]|uniref:hypothetical protein n=1 Tax=Aestuariivirga sp. TaxID=2650926 RepID=UPI003015D35C
MRFFRLFAMIVVLAFMAAAPGTARAEDAPRTVRVGLFITNLFDVDFAQQDVEAQFWVWFNHDDASFDPKKDVEIVNARSVDVLGSSRTDAGSKGLWDQVKFSAVLNENWSVANYPFDRQKIRIVIESATADARSLKFEPDIEGTKLRRDLTLAGWTIEGMKISAENEFYETAYGDPSMSSVGPSIYPRVTVEIDVKRLGWRLMLSTFIGFGLAIALAGIVLTSSAFRHSSEVIDIGAQLAIATGALFSTVGSGYILQSGLPPTTEFSLADAFQLTAFTVTFLTMLMIYVVHVLRKRRLWTAALTTGRVLFALYIVSVVWIVYRVWLAVSC